MWSNLIKAPFRIWMRVLEAEADLLRQAFYWMIDQHKQRNHMSDEDLADWNALIDLISEARRAERKSS
jgi:hypothetical protein